MLRRRLALASFLPLAIFCSLLISSTKVHAQTTSFSYQGKLSDAGSVANGNYDFQFTLWDALTGGAQQPQPSPVTVTKSAVSVSGGIFTVRLDFTVSAFPGPDRFLEISVRPTGGASFTTLAPRQQVISTPYAIRTLNATTVWTREIPMRDRLVPVSIWAVVEKALPQNARVEETSLG